MPHPLDCRGSPFEHGARLCAVLAFILGLPAAPAAEPGLPETAERLTPTQERAVRRALDEEGVVTAAQWQGKLWREILCVPTAVADAYAKKPRATVRLLLKVVEDGTPGHARAAAAYIASVVKGPVFGALYLHYPLDSGRLDLVRSLVEMATEKDQTQVKQFLGAAALSGGEPGRGAFHLGGD